MIAIDRQRTRRGLRCVGTVMVRFFSHLLLLAAACLLTSCGTAFHQPWKQALAKPVPAASIEGPWTGYWKSGANGHSGDLRCIVGPAQAGASRDFYYHATWGMGLFRGSFQAQHDVVESGGKATFTASRSIQRHGFFQAQGTITPGEFRATYRAAGDHGEFVLKRPQ